MNLLATNKQPELAVHLYVTPRCNLSCPHCYYDAFERSKRPERMISLAEIEAVLNGLCRWCEPDVHLEGGEPFMRQGLDRMLDGLDPEVLRTVTVTTNGTVAIGSAPETLRSLAALRVSVDGHTDALQREMRGVELGKVLRTCRSLREKDVPFMVRMTVWRANVRALADIYAWAEAEKIASLSLYEFQPVGRGSDGDDRFGVPDGDFERFLADLAGTPIPECMERLSLHLSERRLDALERWREPLASRGLVARALPAVANCTINYDGSVGISPWQVTAHGAPDVFTSLGEPDFWETIVESALAGELEDGSAAISRAVVELER